ncbi:MAG TPA: hypothetical protein VL984_18085 [Acidimicrobiales bacterium]|nr:hypothetical protein [Acidimicrobiales bacterium]
MFTGRGEDLELAFVGTENFADGPPTAVVLYRAGKWPGSRCYPRAVHVPNVNAGVKHLACASGALL